MSKNDSGFLIGYLSPCRILTLGFTAIYKIIPNTSVSFYQVVARGASCAFTFKIVIVFVLWIFYSARILLLCKKMGSTPIGGGMLPFNSCL